MTPITTFAGRIVAVFGLGISGIATCRALAAGGATVVAADDSAAGRDAASAAGFGVEDLAGADWSRFAALVLAPGVPLTHPAPHWTVAKAKAAGVEIIGDIELFCRERAKLAPEAPFIAITGTNGKSTTTALIAHILRSAGRDVQMGGNIGTAILALEPPALDRVHVIEMSSFQIDLTPTLAPTVGVLLNITPDHLDRHGTIENYAAVKQQLVMNAQHACISVDDEYCRKILARRKAWHTVPPSEGWEPVSEKHFAHKVYATLAFSISQELDPGFVLRGTEIVPSSSKYRYNPPLADLNGLSTFRGRHNAQNALAAICAVWQLQTVTADYARWHTMQAFKQKSEELERNLTADELLEASQKFDSIRITRDGLSKALLQPALATFPGLRHRLEEIGRIERTLFINDSKATNADSAATALAAFPGDIHWIIGGKPKEGGIAGLTEYFPRIAKAYLIGQATEEFAATLEGKVPYDRCGTLEVAVESATLDAMGGGAAAPVVLLSPACASYDQYRNFEIRGDAFRALVEALPGIELRRRDGEGEGAA